MLLSLSIKDLVLIDTLHLTVDAGLSVLTGETGAGKSILLDALGLALGRRGDASLVRQGTEQAVVSAEFCVKDAPQVEKILQEHGLVPEKEDVATFSLVFRRILSREGLSRNMAGGRTRAFINDHPVSIGLLRVLGDALLEIHGQFDRLLDPTSYRTALDSFAKANELQQIVQKYFHAWQEAHGRWQEAERNLDFLRQNEVFLHHQLDDIKKLNPTVGEEETLLQERASLAHIGKLSEAIRESAAQLQGQGQGQAAPVESSLRSALKHLQRAQGQGNGNVDAATAALEKALAEVVEGVAQLQEVADQLADQPHRLQQIDERLHALRSAARKYNLGGGSLTDFQKKLTEQLVSLGQANDILAKCAQESMASRTAYYEAACRLRECRLAAVHPLEQAVMEELPSLMLPHAQFKIDMGELPEAQWGEFGVDRVDFMVAMNKGQAFCSLSKSASGGELARFMLALKVVLAEGSSIPTIIFDEIDTGVGGAVAAAIGERLAKLGHHVQILAITHSPQLAAYAKTHFRVVKEDRGTFMRTSVSRLGSPEIEEELARMLSGAEITTEARAAAQRLLG